MNTPDYLAALREVEAMLFQSRGRINGLTYALEFVHSKILALETVGVEVSTLKESVAQVTVEKEALAESVTEVTEKNVTLTEENKKLKEQLTETAPSPLLEEQQDNTVVKP